MLYIELKIDVTIVYSKKNTYHVTKTFADVSIN